VLVTATSTAEMAMIIRLTTVFVDDLRQLHEWPAARTPAALSRLSEISSYIDTGMLLR